MRDWWEVLADALFYREYALLLQRMDKEDIDWINEELKMGYFSKHNLAPFLKASKLYGIGEEKP